MGFGEFLRKTAEAIGEGVAHHETTKSLMEMSESAGMTHLGILVPEIIDAGWMDDFTTRLRQYEDGLYDATPDDRHKAKTFRVHAELLAARHR